MQKLFFECQMKSNSSVNSPHRALLPHLAWRVARPFLSVVGALFRERTEVHVLRAAQGAVGSLRICQSGRAQAAAIEAGPLGQTDSDGVASFGSRFPGRSGVRSILARVMEEFDAQEAVY